jgi:hypothetical protein
MSLRSREARFYLSILGAFTALMLSGTFAHAQHLYNFEWGEAFNNSAGSESEDSWVANSYTVSSTDRTHIVSVGRLHQPTHQCFDLPGV